MPYYYTFSPVGFIIGLGLAVGLAFIPASIAKRKGYSYGGFWVFGFFLFLVALIVALCIRDKNLDMYSQSYQQPYQQPPYQQPPYQQPPYQQPPYQQPPYQQPYQQPYQGPQPAVCPNCGANTTPDAVFCLKCGTKLK